MNLEIHPFLLDEHGMERLVSGEFIRLSWYTGYAIWAKSGEWEGGLWGKLHRSD